MCFGFDKFLYRPIEFAFESNAPLLGFKLSDEQTQFEAAAVS